MKTLIVATWLFGEVMRMGVSEAPGETPEQQEVRLKVAVHAMAEAGREANGDGWSWTELAGWGVVLWSEESRFDQRVHAGLPHPIWTSDYGRAKCMGQLHSSRLVPPSEWAALSGTSEEVTLQCARATLRVAIAQAKNCGVYYGRRANRASVAQTFAAYGSGGKCKPDDRAWSRADKWLKVMSRRPDLSPVKGYRRVLPGEIPQHVRDQAQNLAWENVKVGARFELQSDNRYLLLVEKHAAGKTGVSVLMRD